MILLATAQWMAPFLPVGRGGFLSFSTCVYAGWRNLPERLNEVAKAIVNGPHSAVCDVGTDHGLLPIGLCTMPSSNCQRVIGIDMNAKPLQAARQNIKAMEVTWGTTALSKIQLRQGYGIDPLKRSDGIRVVSIAGIGVSSIISILEKTIHIQRELGIKRVIIQPAGSRACDMAHLRSFLHPAWKITNESIILIKRRFYVTFSCEAIGVNDGVKSEILPGVGGRMPFVAGEHLVAGCGQNLSSSDQLKRSYWAHQRKCLDVATTIVAMVYDGGVVMGADSRTSTGTYIANRVSGKVSPLHDRIFCCRSGSAADSQAISDYVRYFLASHSVECGRLPTVKTAAHLARRLCYQNKDQLLAGMLIGGWDPSNGGSVYEIPLGGTLLKRNYACGGSGSTYIYGLIDAEYREGMTRDEVAVKFTKHVISHAMARDSSSGGVVRIVVINKEGATREFVPGNRLPYGP